MITNNVNCNFNCSTKHKEKLFFFSIHMTNNKIVIGCGSDDDHFNICCTSYHLLSY